MEPWSEGSLFLWPIYQNIAILRHYPKIGSKRVRTCISYTNGDRKMKVNSKGKFEVNHYFLNSLSQNFDFFDFFESFDFPRWRHQPKNSWKRSKLVFHVPTLIGRWESKVKGTFRWIIPLWNRSIKILKFWLSVVMWSTQNWLEKGSKLVSLVRMVIEK